MLRELIRERIAKAGERFRKKRMARFAQLFEIRANTRVLDIGGTATIWKLLAQPPRVILLNSRPSEIAGDLAFPVVIADARHLPFAAGAFDVVFSNSVIEHVGGRQDQADFAREVRHAGRSYWIQTPNRYFPVEQHLLTPILHWLPKGWQAPLVLRSLTLWDLVARVTPDQRSFYHEHYLKDVRLLTAADCRELFPDAGIHKERLLWLTKSLVAVRVHQRP